MKAGNNWIGVKREEVVGKGVTESIYLRICYSEEIKEAFKNSQIYFTWREKIRN